MSPWTSGTRVEIVSGEHAGKQGTVTHLFSGGIVAVLLDGHSRSIHFGFHDLSEPRQPGLF